MVDESLFHSTRYKQCVVLSYFYQASGRKAKAFFASLLKQLLATLIDRNMPCPAKIRDEIEIEFGLENRQPDIGELVANAVIPLMNMFREVIVILDGPDICEHSEQHELWKHLCKVREFRNAGSRLKIAIASQDHTNITEWLPDTIRLRIDDGSNAQDIDTFIDDRIGSRSGTGGLLGDDPLRMEVQRVLKEKANGM